MRIKNVCAEKNDKTVYEWKYLPIELSHTESKKEFERLENMERSITKKLMVIADRKEKLNNKPEKKKRYSWL